MNFKKIKIGTKFNLLMIAVIIFLAVVIGTVSKVQIDKVMGKVYTDRVNVVSQLGYNWLNETYPGEWSIQNGEIYKGNVKINDNNDIFDKIGSITGGAATIFQGDTRIATNIKNEDGSRSVGTKADPNVTGTVLTKGETYIGSADIVGRQHLTMYQPIKDSNGEIIGMWLVGPPIDNMKNSVSSILIMLIGTIVIVGIIAVIIIMVFTRSIVRPMKVVNEQLREIAEGEGDLTKEIHVKTQDEIGDMATSFNAMMGSLRTMLRQISSTSEQVASSSEELMASSEQTSSATNQVVVSIQEVSNTVDVQDKKTTESAKAMEDITISIKQIVDSVATVAESANETSSQANIGNGYLQQVINQMNNVYSGSTETINVMNQLEGRSKEVGQIIDVITGIADQTNLLALNAAIEAARAGEHGKGFAVVADEVRKLAEQSRTSANQVVEIIKLIQKDTLIAVEMTNQGNEVAKEGLQLTEETGKTFTQILESIEGVNSQTQELSAISQEMFVSIEQVNEALDEIAELAKTSSSNTTEIAASSEEQLATMEEITASSTSLANTAEQLRTMVNRFKF